MASQVLFNVTAECDNNTVASTVKDFTDLADFLKFIGIFLEEASKGDFDGNDDRDWKVEYVSENCPSPEYDGAVERHLSRWARSRSIVNSGNYEGTPERRRRCLHASFPLPAPPSRPEFLTTVANALPQYAWTNKFEFWVRSGTGSKSRWQPTVPRPSPREGLKAYDGQARTVTGNSVYVFKQHRGGPNPNGAGNKSPIQVGNFKKKPDRWLVLPQEGAKLRGRGVTPWNLLPTVPNHPRGHGHNLGEQDKMVGIGVSPAASADIAKAACHHFLGFARRKPAP